MLSALTRAFDANEIFSRFLSIHPRLRETFSPARHISFYFWLHNGGRRIAVVGAAEEKLIVWILCQKKNRREGNLVIVNRLLCFFSVIELSLFNRVDISAIA